MGHSNFSDCFSSSFLKIEDLQLSTLHNLFFFFSETRKSMNMTKSACKKQHLFSRIKGSFFLINVAHTKTLVSSSLLNEIGWFKNNRQIYLQYIHITYNIYIYIYIYIYLYILHIIYIYIIHILYII